MTCHAKNTPSQECANLAKILYLVLDIGPLIGYNIHMENEEYEYNEGSDMDNWEEEQIFQDHEGQEDFGYFGEMGMMED